MVDFDYEFLWDLVVKTNLYLGVGFYDLILKGLTNRLVKPRVRAAAYILRKDTLWGGQPPDECLQNL